MKKILDYWISSLGIPGFERHCCWFCDYFFSQLQKLQEKLSASYSEIMYYCCTDIKQLRNEEDEDDEIYEFITNNTDFDGGIFVIFDKKSEAVLYVGKYIRSSLTKSGLWPVTQITKKQENIVADYIRNEKINLSINDCSVFFLMLYVNKNEEQNSVLEELKKELKKLLTPLVK